MKASSVKVWSSIFAMLLCIQSVSAYSLKGTVYDSSTNAALSGVIVYHKATANRAITGASGVFSLTIGGSAGAQSHQPMLAQDKKQLPEVPAGTDTLVFARAGFEQQELAVSLHDTNLVIKLRPVHEKPGPSPALFAKPYYTCLRNFYVATTGNDANDGSRAHPWRTIQHANDMAPRAGDCINVLPGVYAWGAKISHGGNQASSIGYVVYRSTVLDGAVITDPRAAFEILAAENTPNYVIIDGFELAASSEIVYGQGINCWNSRSRRFHSHHIWVTNCIIHGYGQSGIQMNDGDYYYVIHNTLYNNCAATCDARGSGISFCALKPATGYTPTADDAYNLTFGVLTPFHNVVNWNILHDNFIKRCGTVANPYNTDGNGIIMDVFNNRGETNVVYPYKTLIAFNITYRNGNYGIHLFLSGMANGNGFTVANNTSYNNNLDPANRGTMRGEINNNGSENATVMNNIAVSITGAGFLRYNNTYACAGKGGDSYVNNIDGGQQHARAWLPNVWSAAANKAADPLWVDAPGGNFALKAGSPAIGYGQTRDFLSLQSVTCGAYPYEEAKKR